MKLISKLPLYLGVSIFIVTVMMTAITVGMQKGSFETRSNASVSDVSLSMHYASPGIVSVFLTSQKPVGGMDISIRYDPKRIIILPSTLTAGPLFTTTGGITDIKNGTFSFSTLAKSEVKQGTLVASFTIQAAENSQNGDIQLQFNTGSGLTKVYDAGMTTNILTKTSGVNITVPLQ